MTERLPNVVELIIPEPSGNAIYQTLLNELHNPKDNSNVIEVDFRKEEPPQISA